MTQMGAEGRDPQTYAVIGAAMEVHRELGHGFLEAVYQEALAVEFGRRGIPYGKEVALEIHYKGRRLACSYKADFICYERLLVETKALGRLTGIEEAQVINYLKATGLDRALLINFGAERLEYKRLIFTHHRSPSTPSAPSASSADQGAPDVSKDTR
jgi:GxxExxY protein